VISRHGDKIEICRWTTPDPHRLRCQVNARENSQTNSKTISGTPPGQTEIGSEANEEEQQPALHDVHGEVQEMNSGKNSESPVVRRPGCNRNRGKQQKYGRSPEQDTSELLQARVAPEDAGEKFQR